jgi:hypothetical protein
VVIAYSARDLTYDRDILDGVLGILLLFETSEFPIYHFYGVPIFRILWAPGQHITLSADSVHGFALALLWNLQKPASRRQGFPTWSWTGWKERVLGGGLPVIGGEISTMSAHCYCSGDQPEVLFSGEHLNDGRPLGWASFLRHLASKDGMLGLAPILTLQVWTVNLQFTFFQQRDTGFFPYNFFARLDVGASHTSSRRSALGLTSDPYLYFPLRPTLEIQEKGLLHKRLQTETFEGLILGCGGGEILILDF